MKILINFKNAHKFQIIGYSGIILSAYEGKEEIHKYMQYKIPMNVCMSRIANQKKLPKMAAIYKKGPYGPELFWYFGTKLANSTQLSFSGPYIKAHAV